MSAYDGLAPDFERLRVLPVDVPAAVRRAVLCGAASSAPPLVLDLGAGSGRFGVAFVTAGDRYVGVDLSLGMLRSFAAHGEPAPTLVQADGERLPFADATFDAVLLLHVLSAARDWRTLIAEAVRVLRRHGALFVGRRVAPEDGIDARMKRRLAEILTEMGGASRGDEASGRAAEWLMRRGCEVRRATIAAWTAEATPRMFLERHVTGANFSVLPAPIRETAMQRVREWVMATFGSLDTVSVEPFRYDLVIARHLTGVSC